MNWLKLQKIQLWTEVDTGPAIFDTGVFRARRFSVQSPAKAQNPGRARFFVVHAKKARPPRIFKKIKWQILQVLRRWTKVAKFIFWDDEN